MRAPQADTLAAGRRMVATERVGVARQQAHAKRDRRSGAETASLLPFRPDRDLGCSCVLPHGGLDRGDAFRRRTV
jgi:hypothetical protein